MEKQLALQNTDGKGPVIPFLPPMIIEIRLNTWIHCTWCLNNINLIPPIAKLVWKMWANLSKAKIKAYENKVLTVSSSLLEGEAIANAFLLVLSDHHKCTTRILLNEMNSTII